MLNWEYYLNDKLKKCWASLESGPNPLEYCRFNFLPLITKVKILHALCDFRLDADTVPDALKVSGCKTFVGVFKKHEKYYLY